MMKLKSRLARLFRGWAQRLDPEFKMPPIQYTINRVHRIEVSFYSRYDALPTPQLARILKEKMIIQLDMFGAIKISAEPGQCGGKKYTASMYAMIAGDEEGGVS